MKMFFLLLLFISTASVVAVEETEGMRAMRLGCEKQKLGLGCTNYANFLIKNGRESEADAYFEKGCKLPLRQQNGPSELFKIQADQSFYFWSDYFFCPRKRNACI